MSDATSTLPVLLIPTTPIWCPHCERNVAELSSARAHVQTCHRNPARPNIRCPFCKLHFKTKFNLKLHIRRTHSQRSSRFHKAPALQGGDKKTQDFLDGKLPARELYTLQKSNSVLSKSMHASTQAHTITFTPAGQHIAGVGLVAQLLETIAADLMLNNKKIRSPTNRATRQRHTRSSQTKSYQLTIASDASLDYAISSSFQKNLNFEALLRDVARVSQSATGLQFAADLTMTIFEKTIQPI